MSSKSINNQEISLNELLKAFLNAKIKIIIIIFISCLIGVFHNYQKKNSYNFLVNIEASKYAEFVELLTIYNSVYDDAINPIKDSESYIGAEEFNSTPISNPNKISILMLDRYIKEITDYDELRSILLELETTKNRINKLPDLLEINNIIYGYLRSFNIIRPNRKDLTKYQLSFTWESLDEGIQIIKLLQDLVTESYEKSLYDELDNLLNNKIDNFRVIDLKTINFLKEQSLIARELSLENSSSSVGTAYFPQANANQFSININPSQNKNYYLRGYRVIDKEIELIKSREYPIIIQLKKKINNLKQKNIKWVNYNPQHYSVRKTHNPSFTIMIWTGLGILFAFIYVWILIIKNKIVKKKKR
jgi:hypothetical protein